MKEKFERIVIKIILPLLFITGTIALVYHQFHYTFSKEASIDQRPVCPKTYLVYVKGDLQVNYLNGTKEVFNGLTILTGIIVVGNDTLKCGSNSPDIQLRNGNLSYARPTWHLNEISECVTVASYVKSFKLLNQESVKFEAK